MTLRLATVLAAVLLSSAAFSQEADPHAGHAMAPGEAMTQGPALPAACMAAAKPMPGAQDAAMGGMDAMSDVQKGNMEAMAAMHGPMMQAAAIEDADLAFNCGMIAHHYGAIAMAKVELMHGKDAASKALAGAIVAAQEKEIAEMTAWIDARGK